MIPVGKIHSTKKKEKRQARTRGSKIWRMLIVVPTAAAAAIVLTVAGNCGRNMIQTYQVVRNANANAGTFTVLFPQQQQQQSSSSSSLVQTVTQQRGMTPTDEAHDEDDARDVLTQLQAMTRQQLLEVFVQGSTAPASFEDIYGEWNGCLYVRISIAPTTKNGT